MDQCRIFIPPQDEQRLSPEVATPELWACARGTPCRACRRYGTLSFPATECRAGFLYALIMTSMFALGYYWGSLW